ncbi:hypothetical protein EWB00_007376 [Schistosoma japonicum]|uniref:Uncharacterized protein n=1 Tax=Schistosoma japonicum TaxID=6182 RepID=A0A4Z2CUF7_SCHJA|nr:hypothetical protein EWB00_007376 [Schistosoma japonicum]TNN07921.1 hypothetical protein EWB00_007376 [Schistosoma japonicum]
MYFSIALGLNLDELYKIKDKKDKIKSKIFFKKTEHLFNPEYTSPFCPNNAAYMFRCKMCDKILTKNISSIVPCLSNRFIISQLGNMIPVHDPMPTNENLSFLTNEPFQCNEINGHLKYLHTRMSSSLVLSNLPDRPMSTPNINAHMSMPISENLSYFSCTELLSQWFIELKSWIDVFWKLWATINLQTCKRCGQQFPIIELGDGCVYHTMTPVPNQPNQSVNDTVSFRKSVLPNEINSSQLNGDTYSNHGLTCNLDKTEDMRFHCTNFNYLELLSRKYLHSNIGNANFSRHDKPDYIYPCCGLGLSRFNLFPIHTGCHRSEHILNEDNSDPVTKLCIQLRELIISWTNKRSLKINISSNHQVDLNQIICNKELVYNAPAFTLLACLDKQSNKDSFQATLSNQPIEPIFDVKFANQSVKGVLLKDADNELKANSLTPVIHSNGLLSSTLKERVWDTGKCNRINQDSQRQEDLRRMQKITEFLCEQRQKISPSSEVEISKEVSFFNITEVPSIRFSIFYF